MSDQSDYRAEAADILAVRDLAIKNNVPNAAELADEVLRRGMDTSVYRRLLAKSAEEHEADQFILSRYHTDMEVY